jgi:manganese/zinc/iron transport system permease protein
MSTHLALPPDHVHAPADRMEHYTDPALRDQLAADLANPTKDPHGRPIPPAG